jgi:hypothetical protein
MYTNRVSAYFQQPTQTTPTKPASNLPAGFAPLPGALAQGSDFQEQLYRHALEQARQQIRAKLIDLLRSRARLLGRDDA